MNVSIANAGIGEPAGHHLHVGEIGDVQLAGPGGLELAAHQVRARAADGSGTVVRTRRPLVTPRQPCAFVSRPAVDLATGTRRPPPLWDPARFAIHDAGGLAQVGPPGKTAVASGH